MRSCLTISIIAIVIFLLACNSNRGEIKLETDQLTNMGISDLDDKEKVSFTTDSTISQEPGQTKKMNQVKHPVEENKDWDKKIIKNANLNLEVKDYYVYNSFIRQKVRELGGYIAQEEQNQSDYKIENTITIKVPVDQFDRAISIFANDVVRVNEKRITSQDVTAEYVDTRSRMEAKKQVRLRYIDLLKQAKNMEEILNVQQEVNNIQVEIESAAGLIQYLGHASTFSSIQLTYFQVLNMAAKDIEQPTFGNQLSHAFKVGGSWFADLIIGIVSIWPLFIFIAFAYLLFRKYRNQKPGQPSESVTRTGSVP